MFNNNNNLYVCKGVHLQISCLDLILFFYSTDVPPTNTRLKNIHDSAICCASQCTSDGQQFLSLTIG